MTCQDSFHEVAFNISFWTRNISSARILFWRGVQAMRFIYPLHVVLMFRTKILRVKVFPQPIYYTRRSMPSFVWSWALQLYPHLWADRKFRYLWSTIAIVANVTPVCLPRSLLSKKESTEPMNQSSICPPDISVAP